MQLEHISAVLRPRADAEAVDLGLAMVRRHAAGIYKAWFTLLVPLFAVLIALFPDNPSLVVFVVWWLKPIYDRVVLFYLGRALFGAPPTWREQMRAWPELLKNRPGLSLLWGRLSGARSFTMPVLVLEGLTGKAYRERTFLLKRHGGTTAFGFLQLFMLLELAVVLGLWAGIRFWLPEESMEWFTHTRLSLRHGIDPPPALLWSVAGCYLAAVALLEPFYAGGGFGLYINSRTHLEGWDVDLAFRQLGARLRSLTTLPTLPPTVLLAAVGFFLSFACPAAVMAASVDRVEAKAAIEQVLKQPDFEEHVEKNRTWEPDRSPTPPSSGPQPEGWDWRWLESLWDTAASFFSGDWKDVLPRLLLAIAVVAVAALAGWWLWKHWRSLTPRVVPKLRDRRPRTVMGLDVTPESLPEDLPATAWSLWEGGDPTAAIRLLYRGALAWLMDQGSLTIRGSDTEGDCLRHAGLLPEAGRRRYFADLTAIWLASAYGHTLPPAGAMRELCDHWPFRLSIPETGPPSRGRSGLTVLLLLATVGLTGCKGKWVDNEKELGHLGEAKRNPWLAATRFLELNNIPVLHQRGINVLPDPGGVIIAPAEAFDSELPAQRMLEWVTRGGHLIYLAEGGEPFRNDWDEARGRSAAQRGNPPLLTMLGVSQSEKQRGTAAVEEVRIDGQFFRLSLREELRFNVSAFKGPVAFSAGNRHESALASVRRGEGRITLAAHASAFRNRWIDDDDHAALLLALVNETSPVPQVTFIKAGRVNLWDMLMEHAWPVLLALTILLLVWLWQVLPRFGPVRSLPRRDERRFAHHLDEAGAFLWKQKLTDALLEAPRQAVLAAARRQGLRQEERFFTQLLATRAGLPPERVTEALSASTPADAGRFTRQMADLQTLLFSLQPQRFPD